MQKGESSSKSGRLGRGLASLMANTVSIEHKENANQDSVAMVPLSAISPNPNQPRRTFQDESIAELASSIQSVGVMQPIIVRRGSGVSRGTDEAFEIVAGERRWRAAKLAGLQSIPVIVRELSDKDVAEWSLIENLQREDLNALDRAEAFQQLIDLYKLTQQEIAERLGIDRSSVANHLRLLSLPQQCKVALRQGKLTYGHARSLLGIEASEQLDLAMQHAIEDGWSVRQLERWVADQQRRDSGQVPETYKQSPNIEYIEDLERRLSQHLGTKVQIKIGRRRGTGAVSIEFYTLEQFDGLLLRLGYNST